MTVETACTSLGPGPPRPTINSIESTSHSSAEESPTLPTREEQLTILWHNRLGHASYKVPIFMKNHHKVLGLLHLPSKLPFCMACHTRKLCRNSKPRQPTVKPSGKAPITLQKEERGTKSPLELVHTDICRPLSTTSLSGSRYILTITDDFSCFTWLYFLKLKSEILSKFCHFKAIIELHGNRRLKTIRSDRGGEFTSIAFIKFYDEARIVRQLS